jgi:predicted amidophosphoribosyltransferase
MEELICPKCGPTTEYYTELKSNQNVARCLKCDSFIKNIPYKKPMLYIGKYANVPIEEIEDVGYLKWALKTLTLSSGIKTAIQKQIDRFEHLAR